MRPIRIQVANSLQSERTESWRPDELKLARAGNYARNQAAAAAA